MQRTSRIALLLCAVALAACDASPTMPTPALHPHPLFWFTGYRATSLPFTPTAINGAGVIVGTKDSITSAVLSAVAYSGGTLSLLPLPPGDEGWNSYAVDITGSGHILGSARSAMLIWPSSTSTPLVVTYADSLNGIAMNDSYTVVGTTKSGGAFRWTPSGGVQYLPVPRGYTAATPRYVNASGYIAGTVRKLYTQSLFAIRWAPNGTPTVWTYDPSYPVGMHDNGDILLAASAGSYLTVKWPLSGTSLSISGIPGEPVAAWSAAGRYVGDYGSTQTRQPWTMYDGAVTWLTAPNLYKETVNLIDVNTCGSIIAKRFSVITGLREDSGYVWHRPLTCDMSGTLAGGTSIASPSTAALP